MKPSIAILVLILAGCQPYTASEPIEMMLKSGISFAQQQADEARCEAEALREVPDGPAPIIVQQPATPAQYVAPGEQVHVDVAGSFARGYGAGQMPRPDFQRASLRNRLARACMYDKGYKNVVVPSCTEREVARVKEIGQPQRSTQPLGMGESACVAYVSGQQTIVNRSQL